MNIANHEKNNGEYNTIEYCKNRLSHHPAVYLSGTEIVIRGDVGIKTWGKIDFLCRKGFHYTYK